MQKRWIPFFWVCAALISGTMGTALASPLYPLYQQLWQLQPSDITTMFIAYMGGTLLPILFLGRLSDSLGFAKVLRAGLLLVLMGVGCLPSHKTPSCSLAPASSSASPQASSAPRA